MSEFTRPFRLRRPDDRVLHGAQFPSGRAVVDDRAGVYAATSIDELLASEPQGTSIEWPEEDTDGR